MTVDFGFGLITCQRYPGDPRSDTELYRQALALAEDADAFGIDSVWVSEHHFVDDAYLPSLLPLCAAIAARTRRVRVGTALLLAPLHDPVRLAEDAAVVDLISGGRLVLAWAWAGGPRSSTRWASRSRTGYRACSPRSTCSGRPGAGSWCGAGTVRAIRACRSGRCPRSRAGRRCGSAR